MEKTFEAAYRVAIQFLSLLKLTSGALERSGLGFTILPDVLTPTEREQRTGGTKGRKGDAKSASTARKEVTLNGRTPLLVDPRLANEPARLTATIVAGILRVLYPPLTETDANGKQRRKANSLYSNALLGAALKYDKTATVPAWYFTPDTTAAAWIEAHLASVPSANIDFSAYQLAPPETQRMEVFYCAGADAPHEQFLVRAAGLTAKLLSEHGTCLACGRALTKKAKKAQADVADAFSVPTEAAA